MPLTRFWMFAYAKAVDMRECAVSPAKRPISCLFAVLGCPSSHRPPAVLKFMEPYVDKLYARDLIN